MLSEDGLEAAHTLGGLDVSDHTNDHHGWSLDDGNTFDHLLLVHLCGRVLLQISQCNYTLGNT